MTNPRIAPLDPPYPPDIAEELKKMMPPGVEPLKLFRTLAHNPRVLAKVRLGNLLDRGSIERRDREIVVLRTSARCGAEYEWSVHIYFFARRFGLTEAQIAATVQGTPEDPCWSERDKLLIRLVDELHDTAGIGKDLWKGMSAHWKSDQILELIVLSGFYHMISFVINGVGVELEDGAVRFPG
jgi:alkylhydroperoxidase family enzyme